LIGSASVWRSSLGWGALPALFSAGLLGLVIALSPPVWSAILIFGGVVFVATLLRPQVGVLLLVPAIPFGSLHQVTVGVMNLGLAEVLLALLLAAWLMQLLAFRGSLVLPPLATPLFIFLAVLCFSLLGSSSLQHGIKEVLKWVEFLALYLLVANEMHGRWQKALIFAVLGTGAVVALQGIYQFWFQVGPEPFVLFGRFMRAHGTFDQPNPYGGYLGLVLPVAVGLVLAGLLRVRGSVRWQWVAWAGGCGALMLAALVMSWSRGAWLGFGAALFLMVFAIVVQSGRAAVLAAVFVALLAYALLSGGLARLPMSIIQRFSDFLPYLGVVDVRGVEVTDAKLAVLEPMAHWQSALAMWADRPWLGVGIGNYEPVYARYALPLWGVPLGHAHNYYLNIAAEAGVLGLVTYLMLWGMALLGVWRSMWRSTGWHWGVALGVLGMVAHLSIHQLFDNLYVHGIYLLLAILLGVIGPYAGKQHSDRN
jgi:O-antigen ligase